ncbi:MAG: helix-turn-helix domain-containing protein [Rheinheimera sp.]|nr:helix-turn-helix domain-containing protein [Rheinheimera sp.]
MDVSENSAAAMAAELGERLKQARLNRDLTQTELAAAVGVTRKTIINAEKGKATLEIFVAMLLALQLTQQLELFLPRQQISPLQLAKLQGKQRQRASRTARKPAEEPAEW